MTMEFEGFNSRLILSVEMADKLFRLLNKTLASIGLGFELQRYSG